MPEKHIEVGARHKAELAKLPEARRDRIHQAVMACGLHILPQNKKDAEIILRMLSEAMEAIYHRPEAPTKDPQ